MLKKLPSKASIRRKAAGELREMIILTAYLYVIFAAVIFFKSAVLRGAGVDWMPWGLAIFKAALAAKFVLLARTFRVGERHKSKPLIWPTLHKSAVFLVVVIILTAIEESVVGLRHGRTIWESVASIGGGTLQQFTAEAVLLFLIFCPYFAAQSLGEVLGENALVRLFFVNRQEFRAIEHPVGRN